MTGFTSREARYLKPKTQAKDRTMLWVVFLLIATVLCTISYFFVPTVQRAEAQEVAAVEEPILQNEDYCKLFMDGEYVGSYQVFEYCQGIIN